MSPSFVDSKYTTICNATNETVLKLEKEIRKYKTREVQLKEQIKQLEIDNEVMFKMIESKTTGMESVWLPGNKPSDYLFYNTV